MVDSKVTALTAETAPVGADLVYLVDDVAGTPTSKKATLTDLAASAPFAGLYAPLATPVPFKIIKYSGSGNKTLANTTAWTAIDATNLGYQTLTLAVGDVVRCTLMGTAFSSITGEYGGFDFAVDQPTSADTRCNAGNDFGACELQVNLRTPIHVVALFTATEAGVHGFRPVWRTYDASHSISLSNAASGDDDVPIVVIVEKLGPPS